MADTDDLGEGPHPLRRLRRTSARIGCVALNLLEPGLGLLRVGAGRQASLLLVAPFVWIIGSIALFAVAPTANFAAIVVYAVLAISFAIALYVAAMALTWRRSAFYTGDTHWWSRWYALIGVVVLWTLIARPMVAAVHSFYRPFYLPSESMAPTLGKLDRLMADMRGGRDPHVGDIVLIREGGLILIKRVVALSGDKIAMRGDVPIVNGVKAFVWPAGSARFLGIDGWEQAVLFKERFPRESSPHEMIITKPTTYGEMGEIAVPPGHIFVLGDNRERSADSRLPVVEDGTGMVPLENLVGRPLYITWPHDSGVVGRSVSH